MVKAEIKITSPSGEYFSFTLTYGLGFSDKYGFDGVVYGQTNGWGVEVAIGIDEEPE